LLGVSEMIICKGFKKILTLKSLATHMRLGKFVSRKRTRPFLEDWAVRRWRVPTAFSAELGVGNHLIMPKDVSVLPKI
jgi:hypothetical protein